MAENQYDYEQQAPELPYPASLEGAGMSSPMGGMAPPPLAIPPMPPLPQANPGLAAGYGMMAGLQGQVANPYLAQVPQMQALAVHQQQQMAQQANQMAMMQLRQMQAQQLQQRIDIERKKQQTLEQEAPLKLAGALSKVDTPVAQQISAREYARYMKNTLGIDVKPEDLMGAGTMKKEKSEHIDAMLQVAITQAAPGTPPDLSQILSVYPGTPVSYLESRAQILKDPNARGVIGVKPIQDPISIAAAKSAKLTKDWMEANNFGSNHDLFAIANLLFRQRTGRQLFTATPEEQPLVEDLRARADFLLKQQKEEAKNPTVGSISEKLKGLEEEVRTGKRPPNDPEVIALRTQLDRMKTFVVPPFGGLGGAGSAYAPGAGGAPTEGPRLLKEPQLPPTEAGAAQVPVGTTIAEANRIGLQRGTLPVTGQERTQIDSLSAIGAILDSIERDIKDISPIKTPTERITGSLGRATEIYGQTNPKAAAAYSRLEGSLAKLARAMGEVGTMTEGDINRARELWPVIAPGLRMGGPGGLIPIPQAPDTDAVFAEKLKGLRELFKDIRSRIGQTPEQAAATNAPKAPRPMPAPRTAPQPQAPAAQALPPGTKMENGKLISESGKYEWDGAKWVPRR